MVRMPWVVPPIKSSRGMRRCRGRRKPGYTEIFRWGMGKPRRRTPKISHLTAGKFDDVTAYAGGALARNQSKALNNTKYVQFTYKDGEVFRSTVNAAGG
jgi:hypothetical protein